MAIHQHRTIMHVLPVAACIILLKLELKVQGLLCPVCLRDQWLSRQTVWLQLAVSVQGQQTVKVALVWW